MSEASLALALNAGSSSLKWGIFAERGTRLVRAGEDEWPSGSDREIGVVLGRALSGLDPAAIAVVGHRVVHGGDRFSAPVLVDEGVRAAIRELRDLAPLHNPAALAGIDAISAVLPDVPQVAVFDTAFHQTLEPPAYRYALPAGWFEEYGIRRFGFHGINHAWCYRRAAEMWGTPLPRPFRVVTCHLGSGCSLAAVRNGRSEATTMGYTPLDGIVMATRPGALDPGILLALLRSGRLDLPALDDALHHRAGLAGLSGGISDMRDLMRARETGNADAALAVACFTWTLRAGIASMAAALDGIDALVFSGGIGEHQPAIRAECCEHLGWMGIGLIDDVNAAVTGDGEIGDLAGSVRVFVVAANEERCVAEAACSVVRGRE